MLTDIERKMLRIIVNYSKGRNRIPTMYELMIKTGRNQSGVSDVLLVLVREGYILWREDDPDNIIVLQEWEQ